MSAAVLQPRYVIPMEPVYQMSVAQYHAAIRAGIFGEGDAIELLEGLLVQKMPKKRPHVVALTKLLRLLGALLPEGWSAQSQDPITLDDGEPEPDLAVIRGRAEDYTAGHPGASDVALVVEVSDTTLDRDRGIKLRSYARAAIPAYWIVNLVDRCVEVYSSPDAAASAPSYRAHTTLRADESLRVVIAGVERGDLRVNDLLP
jgi:Uma2 family endonuclease